MTHFHWWNVFDYICVMGKFLVLVWRKSIHFWRRYARKTILTFSFPVKLTFNLCTSNFLPYSYSCLLLCLRKIRSFYGFPISRKLEARRETDGRPWVSVYPDVKNYKWRLNPICYTMLYSCTNMAAAGVAELSLFKSSNLDEKQLYLSNISWLSLPSCRQMARMTTKKRRDLPWEAVRELWGIGIVRDPKGKGTYGKLSLKVALMFVH